jgi:hypothetical protein
MGCFESKERKHQDDGGSESKVNPPDLVNFLAKKTS